MSLESLDYYKIELGSRYVIVVKTEERMVEDSEHFVRSLYEWWESDEKFFIIQAFGDIEVRFERVENEDIP